VIALGIAEGDFWTPVHRPAQPKMASDLQRLLKHLDISITQKALNAQRPKIHAMLALVAPEGHGSAEVRAG
jgi:hypothetical protein